MSDSENDATNDHPFVIFDNPGDIGCNQDFISGDLEWTEQMTTTTTTDEKILQLCVSLMAAHSGGESLQIRQGWISRAFTAQYNTPALGHYAQYFGIKPPAKGNWLRRDMIEALITANVPFLPWDIYHEMLADARKTYDDQDDVHLAPAVDTTALYEAFCLAYPFGGAQGPRKKGDAASTTSSAKATSRAYTAAFKKASSSEPSGLTQKQKNLFEEKGVDGEEELAEAEGKLKRKAMAALHHRQTIERADANFARQLADDYNPAGKRQKDAELDDDDARPISGLLAHDKFLKSMRVTIENSLYIDFASMSKDRLDQLQVLGVASSSSKRLSSSTVLVTSATGADIKTLTFDFEAISSGFLYSYINLLSEASFPDAMARVKDRLAWWQWLTDFFGANKPATVKFIHAFMLKHHKAPFWMPVTEERCSMLAIQARDTCPMPLSAPTFHSGPSGSSRDKSTRGGRAKTPTKVFPGPGTVTVSGGITFTASQTAKLVQWRSRFPGFCQSRMTKDYICGREKRGQTCKYKHDCVWCHSASCKATCAQAEKF
jgi:hypothetical protein